MYMYMYIYTMCPIEVFRRNSKMVEFKKKNVSNSNIVHVRVCVYVCVWDVRETARARACVRRIEMPEKYFVNKMPLFRILFLG